MQEEIIFKQNSFTKIQKTPENLLTMKEGFRFYKNTISSAKLKYQSKFNSDMKIKLTKNPRKFFKYFKPKSRREIPIDLGTLKNHFEKMGKTDMSHQSLSFTSIDTKLCDEILNSPITEDEIRKCAKLLKNNSATGVDNIRNEFIKTSLDLFLLKYLKLFNLILDSGLVPHDWVIGLIIPLYKNKGEATDCNNYRGITLLG